MKFPFDRREHITAGAGVALCVVIGLYMLHVTNPPAWAVLVTGLVGAVEELWFWNRDRIALKQGLPPVYYAGIMNFAATLGGGLAVALFTMFFI